MTVMLDPNLPTLCQICGKQYAFRWHILHIVTRHWNFLEALHNKPTLEETAEKKGV